ncbi:class I SAM-dependent methyltransferase [Ilyomonas limi]|uniref:Class I SAM-dependent methyltransferase n=1 Tax=Ilyomonas limi TaxID=2575867 RepID=A0A4U3KUD6_9BACT|nr:methyltransferase domain-containing protein [Ilyomonas limi]TKK64637.1 class I SAM-dependent methyltransferase [Ilyomonas limi]
MTFSEAAQFLSATPIDNLQPAQWADLGCGNGLFTTVLSARLHSGSNIYAVDKRLPSSLQTANNEITITPVKADFVEDDLALYGLSGILMANALHYVKNKTALLQKLKTYLLPDAIFIIIEYDTTRANQWVPYPVPFTELQELFAANGFQHVQKTGERKSLYQSGRMYVCLVKT